MKEIEAKILEIDRRDVEKRLVDLGAKKIFDGDILTMFFDFRDGSIVGAKNVLRLRKEGDKVELTFKKVHFTDVAKVAEEYSVEVSNLQTVKEILENLGLHETESMEKWRISYQLENARFDIDRYLGEYAYIPEFMEIEAKNEGALNSYANVLGFGPEKCLPWSTKDVIQYYSKKNGP